ncbi:alpha-glucuronidase family glycosyl hydrolase [Planctomycetota bacterium]
MKRVILWLFAALVASVNVNPCSAGSKVTLLSDEKNPKIAFAMQELQGALADRGHTVSHESLAQVGKGGTGIFIVLATQADTAMIDAISLSKNLKSEGFSIRKTSDRNRVVYWVVGRDAAGAMYGGLELAEVIRCEDLEGIQTIDQNPYMALRGIKFNCPLDERTPTYSNHNGDSQRKNVLVMWDLDFWKAYIDDLARFRYNYLSLWNLHPFPSMVRVPGYEKVALDDVQSVMQTLKMTMDEKIAFWRNVMSYAKDRNVDIYVVTWNIFITGEDGIYSREGQYGLTHKFDNPVTTDYYRKSVKQLILTYPDLAGIGLTTGERMPDLTTAQKEAWAFATYGQGVLDAAAVQPGRKIRLIHRQHQTGAQAIAKTFQPLLDHPDIDFIFSFKYAKAHVHSSTTQPYCNSFVKDIGKLKTIWTLRNDSNFYFRWGAPDFVREFIQNIPFEVSKGFYYGSDGYIWGREFLSKEPETPRQLEMAKHWYHWMLWGRLGYNPDISNDRFIQILNAHFPQVPARDLFTAWQEASMIYPVTTGFHWGSLDFQWYIEGCCSKPSYAQTTSGFHDINRFITLGTHPGTDKVEIPDYVEAVSSGRKVDGTTPIQVSQQLHACSDMALQILDKFPQVTDKELKRTLGDIRAMATLGKYYAHKIRGATELALFRKNQKADHRSRAVDEMTQAASHWDLYTSTALDQYNNPIDLNRNILVDWQALRKEVQRDIAIAGGDPPK